MFIFVPNKYFMSLRSKIIIGLSIVSIFVIAVLGNFGGRLIIQINSDLYHQLKAKHLPTTPHDDSDSEVLTYTSNDGLKLVALLVKSDSLPAKGTVILVHGIRSGKEYYLPVSKRLARNGYNSVLVDLRAHGQSEGDYCTFGFYEKQDISVLVDSLSHRKDIGSNFGIWGNSLGAAVSLQALSIDKRIEFGVIESTFTDFRTIVHEYAENTIGINLSFVNDYSVWWAEQLGDFLAEEVKPIEAAKNIHQPVIVVHGNADRNIDIKYGKQNFECLASNDKEFIEVPGAAHMNVWKVGGEVYFNRVIGFINRVSVP
jgi:pimeloyl-ACP methyl ester carboxylesterase